MRPAYEFDPSQSRHLRRRRVAGGPVRAHILEVRQGIVGELVAIDAQVQRLVHRRTALIDGLYQTRDALKSADWHRGGREPMPNEVRATPTGTIELRGAPLRTALRRVLAEAGRELTIDELDRGLRARGMHAAEPHAKRISNAMAVERRRGAVVRTRRGEYALRA